MSLVIDLSLNASPGGHFRSKFRYIIDQGENVRDVEKKGFSYLFQLRGLCYFVSEKGLQRLIELAREDESVGKLTVQPLKGYEMHLLAGMHPTKPITLNRLIHLLKRVEVGPTTN